MIKNIKIVKWLVPVTCLIVAFFVVIYFIGINSEPYRVAIYFIDNNASITHELGKLESKHLDYFGYSIYEKGTDGGAQFKVVVKGEHGEGNVYLKLNKSLGEWKVLQANLIYNNKTVTLLN
jgi:hypothetical protein